MKVIPVLFIPIIATLLLASIFGAIAQEVHTNGFGGITPLNTTGLSIFNDSLKRSFDYESDSLVLSAEFSILETNGDIRDFSLFDNDLTRQNGTASPEPNFVDSTFRTSLETINTAGFYNETVEFDTSVQEGAPTFNFGNADNITVLSQSSFNQWLFLVWNLSSIPSNIIITNARMVLNSRETQGAGFPRTYDAEKVSEAWVEGDVTWNDQPGVTGSAISITATSDVGEDVWVITDFVQDWVDGTQTNYGVRVKDQTNDASPSAFTIYDSSENATNNPYLEITFGVSQWASAPHSEPLDMENTNVSLIWWGQITSIKAQNIMGKGCGGAGPYNYGLHLESDNTISAFVANNSCVFNNIQTSLPNGGLDTNRTYGIGVVFEDNAWGADVHFWLDGEWIYNETSTRSVGDTNSLYYIGRGPFPLPTSAPSFCNCTHDEVLVFKERLDNSTMKLLTTKQHDIVIKSGPSVTTPGFAGLFFALPWLIVFGLLGWVFFVIFMAWREPFTRE